MWKLRMGRIESGERWWVGRLRERCSCLERFDRELELARHFELRGPMGVWSCVRV